MLAKLNTLALVGIDAVPVEVKVATSAGLPEVVLAGLPVIRAEYLRAGVSRRTVAQRYHDNTPAVWTARCD